MEIRDFWIIAIILGSQLCFNFCEDVIIVDTNSTSRLESYLAEERPWCPPSRDIYPCTCDGPQRFLLLTCDRIEDPYILVQVSRNIQTVRDFGKFSLTNSRLTSLESGMLDYLRFEYIYVRKNTIRHVETGFFDSSRETLKRIEIVHNDIEKFPFKELSSFPKLENINLKYNSLKSLPDEAFGKTVNNRLKKIDLSFNKLSHIGANAFKNIIHLELLDLRYNKLTVVNNYAFAGFKVNQKLTLDLSNNKIMFISEGAFDNQIFKCLNLTENNLGKFPRKVFYNNLKGMADRMTGFIAVYHNRFRCTCENTDDMEWLVRLSSFYKDRVLGLECSNLDNKNIQNVNRYDMGCSTQE